MILISHRGNTEGPNCKCENTEPYILKALNMGFDVEIDVWRQGNTFYLGHNKPKIEVSLGFLKNKNLWCHAKNLEAAESLAQTKIHYFWHEEDSITITSKGYMWAHSKIKDRIGKQFICCYPSLKETSKEYKGICSDFIGGFKI